MGPRQPLPRDPARLDPAGRGAGSGARSRDRARAARSRAGPGGGRGAGPPQQLDELPPEPTAAPPFPAPIQVRLPLRADGKRGSDRIRFRVWQSPQDHEQAPSPVTEIMEPSTRSAVVRLSAPADTPQELAGEGVEGRCRPPTPDPAPRPLDPAARRPAAGVLPLTAPAPDRGPRPRPQPRSSKPASHQRRSPPVPTLHRNPSGWGAAPAPRLPALHARLHLGGAHGRSYFSISFRASSSSSISERKCFISASRPSMASRTLSRSKSSLVALGMVVSERDRAHRQLSLVHHRPYR